MSINGLEAVISGLDNLSTQSQADVQAVIEKHTQGTFDDSQAAVPVLTGALQGSGHADIAPIQGTVAYDAIYSLWVNDGHHTKSGSYVPPNPFLTAPFFQHAQAFESDMKDVVQ